MKQLIIIFSLATLLATLSIETADAQLITDSDRRLKTEKGDKKSLFKKRIKSKSGPERQANKVIAPRSASSPYLSIRRRKTATPRYTQIDRGSLFRSKRIAPRYTDPRSPFRNSKVAGAPRSATGYPFSRKVKRITPRYSPGSPFNQRAYSKRVAPRSITGSPFQKSRYVVNPRYSSGAPFDRKYKRPAPRMSPGSPFTKKDRATAPIRTASGPAIFNKEKRITPRYSAGSPFSKKDKIVAPRLSPGSPFTKKEKVVAPRLSPGSPFTKSNKVEAPRTASGSPFRNDRVAKNKPRFSTNEHRFDQNKRMKKENQVYDMVSANSVQPTVKSDKTWYYSVKNLFDSWKTSRYKGEKVPYQDKNFHKSNSADMASYEGSFKQKWINRHDPHPSFPHRKANQDVAFLRESLRKWNIFLARLNGNKVQPDAVNHKVSKPKFDRKEADIWND